MDFADFFDLRMLVVLAASSLWMPFAKLIWKAVNPYPHLFTDKRMRREGPQIDLPLVSEEWAEVRKQRNAKTPATTRADAKLRKLPDRASGVSEASEASGASGASRISRASGAWGATGGFVASGAADRSDARPTRPARRGFRPVLRHLEGQGPSERTQRRA